MSALSQARGRVPRMAEAAVERARLTVVPRRVSRSPRVPFVTLVSLLLVGGVAGLLLFNTSMQQASFTATALEQRAAGLEAQQQSLQMQLERLRDPQRVALRAREMGMVPPSSPAFIRLSDGSVLGNPMPATVEDAVRVVPLPTRKPKNLRPEPVVLDPPKRPRADHGAAGQPDTTRENSARDGAANQRPGERAGTKSRHDRDRQQGGQR